MISTDKRYRTARWKKVRLAVLRRDGEACRIVDGCQRRATVADHIVPGHEDMADHEFFAMSNLRAGCQPHNMARGIMLATTGVKSVASDGTLTMQRPVHSLSRPRADDRRSRNPPPFVAHATIFRSIRRNALDKA